MIALILKYNLAAIIYYEKGLAMAFKNFENKYDTGNHIRRAFHDREELSMIECVMKCYFSLQRKH